MSAITFTKCKFHIELDETYKYRYFTESADVEKATSK